MPALLTRTDFRPYQEHTTRVAEAQPMSMLHLDVGLGKTPVTLETINSRFEALQLGGVLVVAPKRVCQLVWRQEAVKWDFSRWMKFSSMHGPDAKKRLRALMTPANIYLINYENLGWLAEELLGRYIGRGKYPPFNMLVLDEVDKMRSTRIRQGVERGKALLQLLPYFPYRMGLTGTPAGEGWLDLFGQYLCIDSGERLGKGFSAFQKQYFALDGYGSKRWVLREGASAAITKKIGDITVSLSGDEYLKLPPYVFSDHWVELPPALRKQYDKIEREMIVELESGNDVEVFNAASLTNRCLQFSSGAIFLVPGEPEFEAIHKMKLDALNDIVGELSGEPVLVAYQFRHEAERILKDRRFKGFVWFNSKMNEREANKLVDDWVAGRIPGIVGHPGCVHPSTEVLTEFRGWRKITEVSGHDRVFDGVDFVQHGGCSYSGVKPVMEVFGVKLTPDHRVLVGGHWEEAQYVKTDPKTKQISRYALGEETVSCGGRMRYLREQVGDTEPTVQSPQPTWINLLRALHIRYVPPHVGHQSASDLDGDAGPCKGRNRRELRRAWCKSLRCVVRFSKVLCRHGRRVFGRLNDRTGRRERGLLRGELYVGVGFCTAGEQAGIPACSLPGGDDPSRRIMSENRTRAGTPNPPSEPRHDRSRSYTRRERVILSEKSEISKTYDLVNCGPRHRFLVRNPIGEIFTVHNSMGHGIDRLQHGGRTVVWYGAPWSYRMYHQTNGRLRRSGQTKPVLVPRILMRDTVDEAVRTALERKSGDEMSVRQAISDYWKQKQMRDD